jgi:hypothetical protein
MDRPKRFVSSKHSKQPNAEHARHRQKNASCRRSPQSVKDGSSSPIIIAKSFYMLCKIKSIRRLLHQGADKK